MWSRSESIALVTEFSQETAPKIFSQEVQAHLLFIAKKSDKDHDKKIETIKPIAKKFRGDIICVFVDADVEENEQVLEFFGLSKDDVPEYLIYQVLYRYTLIS
jgi:protein disulfide-isomerase A1